MELVPNIILNPGFMDNEPTRPRETYAASIIKSTECPGPGKPRRVWFSSILNLRIFYRTDSGLISWSWAADDCVVKYDKLPLQQWFEKSNCYFVSLFQQMNDGSELAIHDILESSIFLLRIIVCNNQNDSSYCKSNWNNASVQLYKT